MVQYAASLSSARSFAATACSRASAPGWMYAAGAWHVVRRLGCVSEQSTVLLGWALTFRSPAPLGKYPEYPSRVGSPRESDASAGGTGQAAARRKIGRVGSCRLTAALLVASKDASIHVWHLQRLPS